ncbi:MAG TPA: DUF2007 domain-containing protein [Pirellulales bacterium]|jgi:hypothetical protein|nr:DUF2007 domain-containing protein [Pirellulales bacterium]
MDEKLVTVATYPQPIMAHMARNFLDEHGVRAFIADEHTTHQSWTNFIEVKVQVPSNDAERAMALLATIRQP